jgi:hypothetical protein
MLLSRVPTLSTPIWPSLNALFIKLVVRTGQTLIKSLYFVIVSILHYAIDLLSSSTSLISTPILYELSNSWPVVPRLLYHLLTLPLLAIPIDIIIIN